MPTIDGLIEQAPPGVQGFDANTPLTTPVAAAFVQSGFRFCVRYLSRSTPGGKGDLTRTEAQAILAGGLALMAVQHVLNPGWTPSLELGTRYGDAAVANAQAAGLPGGINIWLDLEGVKADVSAGEVIAYCNEWFGIVARAGYRPGLYVGAEAILTGDELYWRLKTKHYWRSGSKVPDLAMRGYQLIQRITAAPDEVNGIEIDRDVTVTDAFGDTVWWLAPRPAPAPASLVAAGRKKAKGRTSRAKRRT